VLKGALEVQVNRIVVGASGSAGSLVALRYAADLAHEHNCELLPVLAWTPPGGDLADRRFPSAELRAMWVRNARQRLWKAIELGIGGPPAALPFVPQVVRGEPGAVLTQIARQDGDVLVVGTGRHGALRRLSSCRVARYCLAHAVCPVFAVPPAELADNSHGLRGWRDRHRVRHEPLSVSGA
jgi:nucleotide-binding universal stress UspA family protein